jgi:hypothetical protein
MSATFAGEITPEESQTLLNALLAQARVIEVNDLEKRVSMLEAQQQANAYNPVPPTQSAPPDTPAGLRATLMNLDDDESEE